MLYKSSWALLLGGARPFLSKLSDVEKHETHHAQHLRPPVERVVELHPQLPIENALPQGKVVYPMRHEKPSYPVAHRLRKASISPQSLQIKSALRLVKVLADLDAHRPEREEQIVRKIKPMPKSNRSCYHKQLIRKTM